MHSATSASCYSSFCSRPLLPPSPSTTSPIWGVAQASSSEAAAAAASPGRPSATAAAITGVEGSAAAAALLSCCVSAAAAGEIPTCCIPGPVPGPAAGPATMPAAAATAGTVLDELRAASNFPCMTLSMTVQPKETAAT